MWFECSHAMQLAMPQFEEVDDHHPVWSDRPYSVFLYTPDDVAGRVKYVNDNFEKHGLSREIYPS